MKSIVYMSENMGPLTGPWEPVNWFFSRLRTLRDRCHLAAELSQWFQTKGGLFTQNQEFMKLRTISNLQKLVLFPRIRVHKIKNNFKISLSPPAIIAQISSKLGSRCRLKSLVSASNLLVGNLAGMTWPFQVESSQLYCTHLQANPADLNQWYLMR